jgi:aspartate aminotransferase/aminotransferase
MDWKLDPNLPTSGIREILNHALARPGTIRLETGEPNFPPPGHILDAFMAASRAGHNRYTATEGIAPLREALAEKLRRVNNIQRGADEILVTPGGIPGLFLAFMGAARAGDEILIPDPGWPDYLGGLASLGIHTVPYALRAPVYKPDVDELTGLLTERTRAIVLNCPGNPTGQLLNDAEMQVLCEWAVDHDLWIISDEVYDQIVFAGRALSPAQWVPDRTLGIYSFSKTYAMTGWRLGYMTGPRWAIDSLTRVAMGAWSSVSEPLQYAGLAALTGPQNDVETMRGAYQRRRDLAEGILRGFDMETSHPDGAFYLLARIGTALPSRAFALRLLEEEGVAVAPGSAFGENAEHWVRISLASSEEALTEGLTRMAHFTKRIAVQG